MINFATLQGLTIPEGVVTKIEDASGRVLWAVPSNEPIVLEVEKQTRTTYAGETQYTDEQFILLDIYPKTASSRVKVTYGGLTKTLTFSGTNAKQVYFGTFNGISDSVITPTSGILTIEGGYSAFGCGMFATSSKDTIDRCTCVTAIIEWGNIKKIPDYAFGNMLYPCELEITSLPNTITSIGAEAFYYCRYINITQIPEGVISIGNDAFYMGTNTLGDEPLSHMTSITLPTTIESIGDYAFAWSEKYAQRCYCSVVNPVTILATTPPTLGTAVFGDYPPKIIVPKGCGAAYKAAEGWSNYADVIVEAS